MKNFLLFYVKMNSDPEVVVLAPVALENLVFYEPFVSGSHLPLGCDSQRHLDEFQYFLCEVGLGS